MYISPMNSSQNINSKAKFSLFAEANLLPRNASKHLKQKVALLGTKDDMVSVAIMQSFDKATKVPTNKTLLSILHICPSINSHEIQDDLIIEGSFRERQKKTLGFINDYIDNLKMKFEK